MPWSFGTATSPSLTRDRGLNQDAVAVASISLSGSYEEKACLAVCLADGMGSLDNPEQASSLAVRVALGAAITETISLSMRPARMIVQANNAILAVAGGRNLGTTLTCVICQDNEVYVGHIGDARLVHVRDTYAHCISVDHTKLAEHLSVEVPSLEEVKNSALSQKLLKSLGEAIFDESYVYTLPGAVLAVENGDHLILCSDGVWTEVTEAEMVDIVNALSTQNAAERLVALALERDPTDDASAVVISFSQNEGF